MDFYFKKYVYKCILVQARAESQKQTYIIIIIIIVRNKYVNMYVCVSACPHVNRYIRIAELDNTREITGML